ncbi:MAG: FAD-dependent oxidoreductase [Cyclobacteriaceae bacterium]|nr:FAD-dependent oxidoreductase [Cyclobacteriaceae bacterium]MCH8516771.1 FAD-dependent oxidoreductase [Cyclobacteriaceae bacterium]
MLKNHIIIIGAGAAGLFAGQLLEEQGIDYLILEAKDAYGGRLEKNIHFSGTATDLGAQWLHGKNNLIGRYIEKNNIYHTADPLEMSFWFRNEIVSELPESIEIFTGKGHPDISFADYARQKGLGEDYDDIIYALSADLGASPDKISVGAFNREEEGWSSGSMDYKFADTYFDVIDQLISPKVKEKIIFNAAVMSIDYSKQNVIEVKDTHGNTYQATKVIVTVPISILQEGSISFIPPLAEEKQNAIKKIGMEAGMKVFLQFSEKFFHPYLVGGTVCAAYLDEGTGKKNLPPTLLAYLMGRQAEAMSALESEEAIINALLEELDEMYEGKASQHFEKALIKDWTKDPYIKGAYSYSSVGIGDARKIAAASLENKLYFGGEAMNTNGHHQTVHGAMERSKEIVDKIINDIKSYK